MNELEFQVALYFNAHSRAVHPRVAMVLDSLQRGRPLWREFSKRNESGGFHVAESDDVRVTLEVFTSVYRRDAVSSEIPTDQLAGVWARITENRPGRFLMPEILNKLWFNAPLLKVVVNDMTPDYGARERFAQGFGPWAIGQGLEDVAMKAAFATRGRNVYVGDADPQASAWDASMDVNVFLDAVRDWKNGFDKRNPT